MPLRTPATPRLTGDDIVASAIEKPGSPLRILLVEDHVEFRGTLRRLLSRRGRGVDCAATFAEALSVAETYRPNILLTDIGRPDGSRVQLLALIRAFVPNCHGIPLAATEWNPICKTVPATDSNRIW